MPVGSSLFSTAYTFYRILGTLHLSFIAVALYHYLVKNFDNILAVIVPFWFVSFPWHLPDIQLFMQESSGD
jgi:hypothetical protein